MGCLASIAVFSCMSVTHWHGSEQSGSWSDGKLFADWSGFRLFAKSPKDNCGSEGVNQRLTPRVSLFGHIHWSTYTFSIFYMNFGSVLICFYQHWQGSEQSGSWSDGKLFAGWSWFRLFAKSPKKATVAVKGLIRDSKGYLVCLYTVCKSLLRVGMHVTEEETSGLGRLLPKWLSSYRTKGYILA